LAAVDDIVDELVLRSLEPAIAALDTLLGGGDRRSARGGEPDGYDGISRTGAIDQLLPSDWLLVGEEPDEFIRRYEWRELGYLHRHLTAPRAAPTTLALFDTGPAQLGRPRVAQLAVLITLARRANAAGVPMRWGTLDSLVREELRGAPSLLRFVRARTFEPPDLHPLDALVDDALVVSPAPVAASHRLVLEEAGQGIVATLVDQRRSVSRQVRLPLPEDQAAIRVLRDPVRRAGDSTPAPGGQRAASNLVFDAAGNKLLTRATDGRTVLVIPAPSSVNEPPSTVRRHPTLAGLPPVTAAGRVGRGSVSITIRPASVYVYAQRARRDWVRTGGTALVGDLDDRFDPDTVPLGRLWESAGQLYAVAGTQLVVGSASGFRIVPDDDVATLTYGHRPREVAVRPAADGWTLSYGSRSGPAALLPGDLPVGAALHERFGAAAVVVGADRRAIELVDWDGRRHLVARSPAEIVDGVAHQHRPRIAVRTTGGGVLLWDWAQGQRLLDWVPT
jgi:hypothetical protein